MKKEYSEYLKKRTVVGQEESFFNWFAVASAACILLLIGFLINIGYIPILKLIHASADFDFAIERSRIGETYFIHPYISNIFVLMLIPLLSYISFSYFIVRRTKRWGVLSLALFAASVIVKTYKFEKSPLVFYLVAFILLPFLS